jgi:hypothetical protein
VPSPARAHGDVDRRPNVAELLPRLLLALEGRGWVGARTLSVQLGTDDRSIRQAASDSGGRVIGGQNGYCLTRSASANEVRRCIGFLLGQAARMKERAFAIRAHLLQERSGMTPGETCTLLVDTLRELSNARAERIPGPSARVGA